ncbi:MAG: protein of unknown function YibQ [Massilibacillus sp.]|nr:protein of unknown function YibQ [Massilibacillus sp.]
MANEGKNKTTTTKKQIKGSSRKTSSKRPWAILGIAILLIGTYFYFINYENKDKERAMDQIQNYTIEKTGAGTNANFTEKTKQIHTVVDKVLQDKNVTVLDTTQVSKTVKRQKIEGNISWNARQMPVSIANGAVDELRAALDKAVNKIGAKIINVEPDQYNGNAVMRLDIGIEDELDGDQITIVADKLYVMQRKTSLTDKSPPLASKGGSKAKLALVIDDFGYTEEPINAYEAIDRPMTFAILPNHPYSKEAANRGYKSGRQIILHLPMEAMSSSAKVEAQTINVNISDAEIRAMVNELTEAVPHIIGVNNHQGSKATSNQHVMKVVLNELASKGLFFIDSKTIASSVAYDTAKAVGVKTGENKIFLDNSSDVDEIKRQLMQAGNIALKNGSAIVIGHARLNTAKAIKEFIPELENQGIELVFASDILK